jgi:hypothetical protein
MVLSSHLAVREWGRILPWNLNPRMRRKRRGIVISQVGSWGCSRRMPAEVDPDRDWAIIWLSSAAPPHAGIF